MRALGVVMAAVAFLVLGSADGVAQTDLSGMWTLTMQTEQGDQPLPVTIVQDGETLKATGEVPDFGPIEMVGTIDGSEVAFEWVVDAQGMEVLIVLTGTVADDGTISGTADFGGFAQGGWSAKREEG